MTLISSLQRISSLTRANSCSPRSCASSMTRIDLVIRLLSTLPERISATASATICSEPSTVPFLPRMSNEYEWKVLISTYSAALPIRALSRFLNSVAAALENVSIRSCSDLTSSRRIKEASLRTRTYVLPLPGPAGTTMNLDSLSLIMSDCVPVRLPNNSSYFFSLMFLSILFASFESKYFFMKALKSSTK